MDLIIEKVNKWYTDDVHVIKDMDLTVRDGEFMVFVGPSGCGKSTLLRMIAGLERVDSGTIAMDGRVINQMPPKDRDIAMVFQNYALYPHMKVYDNLAFPLKMRRWNKEDIRARVEEVADSLDLTEYLNRRPGALSGGQRQRVALGRAMVRSPQLFLMDEPLSNLDAKLRVKMRREIVDLQRRLGTTTIYVTHDQTEAMTMGTRIAIMKDGVLQQVDTPQNVYDRPANLFAAQFVGSPPMNVWSGEQVPGFNEMVSVGVRPEHILPGTVGELTFHAHIDHMEHTGRECIVYLSTESLGPFTMAAEASFSGEVGTVIPVSISREKIFLFDKETGLRLDGTC